MQSNCLQEAQMFVAEPVHVPRSQASSDAIAVVEPGIVTVIRPGYGRSGHPLSVITGQPPST